MKKLLLSLFILSCLSFQLIAQVKVISGKVTAKDDGLPLPGVSVVVLNSTIGTQTDINGNYSISITTTGGSIKFSYVGFISQTINVGSSDRINISLASDAKQLGEVIVVGALGIKRQSKENGYAAQNVSSRELTQTSVTNVANGLTGKVSGLQVNTINNGIDPGTRIVLRGNRSINGNNAALIVLDGVPVPGSTLNSINPNDIQDVNVLKGASASALYGSEASNGALIITTKRGTANGKPVIKYGNSFQLQKVAYFPDFQTKFGTYGGEGGTDIDPITGFARYVSYENQNYGPAFNGQTVDLGAPLADGTQNTTVYSALAKDPRKSFFDTGLTEQNDISYAQGDVDNSFFFSAQNVYTKGVVPDDNSKRTSARFAAAKRYGIFKVDLSLGYTNTKINTFGTSYDGSLLYTNVIQSPANLDLDLYKDPNGKFSNPNDFYSAYHVNPYWQIKNSRIQNNRDVILGNVNFNLAPTKWFDVTYRIAQNFGISQQRLTKKQVNFSAYAISDPLGAGNVPSGYPSGTILGNVRDYTQFGDGSNGSNGYSRFQQDALLNFHPKVFEDFKTELLLGATAWQQKLKFLSAGSDNLLIPDFYNINTIAGTVNATEGEAFIRQIGVYGSLNIGYKNYAFLEVTGRNDFDSRLSKKNRSFFYPSVKGSFIFTDAIESLKNNRIITYGKLRAAYSEVGQVSVGPYSLNNTFNVTGGFPYGSLGALSLNPVNNNPDLKPEKSKEIEVGTELGLLDSRVNFGLTYYKTNTTNQTIQVQTSSSTGYTNATINIGEIENKGFEVDLKLAVLQKPQNKINLDLGGNLGIYDSKVISLIPGVADEFQISGTSTSIFAVVGQPYPVIKGTDLLRDPQGRVIVSPTTGYPIIDPTQRILGRATPKYILGLNASVNYKFITLTAVAEYRGGHKIFNSIGSTLNFGGISATSASADRQRFIFPNSVIANSDNTFTPNTQFAIRDGNYGFWQGSAYNRVNAPYVSSAAFWKLREAILAFDLTQFIKTTKYVKGVSFAFTGRNLLLFKPKNNPWSDPEFSLDNSNAVGQTSAGQTPNTRIFGANLQVTF